MIVHGERWRVVHVRAAIEKLAAWEAHRHRPPRGPDRQCSPCDLVSRSRGDRSVGEPGVDRLLEAGDLACGLLDWAHGRRGGVDDAGELEDASHDLVLAAARGRSIAAELERLSRFDLPGRVEVNAALEGFAHQALDPDRYARAARYARVETPGPDRVIGIRSIGLPLAGMVAAALGPGAVLASVRPTGERHRRSLAIGPALRERLLAGRGAFAVVDEGPGLSGSTFAAVAGWLAGQGVPAARVAFFPGHGGDPGPRAGEDVRRIWRQARRYLAEPDLGFLTEGSEGVDDLAGGRWRYRLGLQPVSWPPADTRLERRKLIVERGGRQWLCKFAGLGALGRTKAARADRLAAAGLHPEVAGLERGFLTIEWHDGARPLGTCPDPLPRPELVSRLAEYLAARAAMPPSDGGPGAPPAELLAMAARNTRVALGDEAGREVDRRWRAVVPRAAAAARPVGIDGRLQRWEWIALADGRLLKTDAVDHALGHDLVGEQDIAWDLAGAALEFELEPGELERVRGSTGDAELEEFYRVAYAAFHLGLFAMAESLARETGHDDEALRLAGEVRRYRRHLARLVAGG